MAGQPADTEYYPPVPPPPVTIVTVEGAPPAGQGWGVGFGSLSPNRTKTPALIQTACIRKQESAWALESVNGSCNTADGSHEILWMDFGTRTLLADAAFDQLNTAGQSLHDWQARTRFTCHRRITGTDNLTQAYRNVRNICVSNFSKTDVVAGDVLTHSVLSPIMVASGIEMYHVSLDTSALLNAAISSGAIDEGLVRTREAIGAAIVGSPNTKDLLALRAAGAKILASDPALSDQLAQRLAGLQALEAAQAAMQAKAMQAEEAKQAEVRRQQQLQAQKAEEQRVAQNSAATKEFRRTLKVGAETHCGLVLSMNGPVAVVQAMAPIGQYGLKISQLYPPGLAQCRFLNGTYQDPGLPY